MQIPKASDADKERFRSLAPVRPDVVVKPMFGNLGAFVNGNMFAGLFGPTVGVRLSEADLETLRAVPGTGSFGPAERPMGGYVGLPEAWSTDPARAAEWVERAYRFAAALPPKQPKARKPAS